MRVIGGLEPTRSNLGRKVDFAEALPHAESAETTNTTKLKEPGFRFGTNSIQWLTLQLLESPARFADRGLIGRRKLDGVASSSFESFQGLWSCWMRRANRSKDNCAKGVDGFHDWLVREPGVVSAPEGT